MLARATTPTSFARARSHRALRPSSRGALAKCAWIAVLFAFCNSAQAASPELELHWDALSECPDRAAVETRIEAQLARKLTQAIATLEVTAKIAEDATGYTLALETVHDGSCGGRTLRAATCDELAAAAALVIALSLASLDEARAQAPAAESAAPTSPPPAVRDELATDESQRSTNLSLRASALFERGALPRATGGVELAGALRWRRSRFTLGAVWLPTIRGEPASDGSRVDVALGAARLGYCHDLAGQRFHLAACAALEGGVLSGRGAGRLVRAQRQLQGWTAGML